MKTFRISTEVWAAKGLSYERVAGPTFEVQASSHLDATMPLVAQGFKCTAVEVL